MWFILPSCIFIDSLSMASRACVKPPCGPVTHSQPGIIMMHNNVTMNTKGVANIHKCWKLSSLFISVIGAVLL